MDQHEHPIGAGPGFDARNPSGTKTVGEALTSLDSAGLPVFGERQLRDFEASPCPMRIFDHETLRYLAVNDAALEFYGYTREEFLTLTVKDTRHRAEHASLFATLAQRTGYLMHWGLRRHVTKSGAIKAAEIVTQDILFNGRNARLSLTIDLTARARMHELLRRREQEFGVLVGHAPDIISRLDRGFRHLYVNPAITAATGRSPGDFIGKSIAEVGMPPDLVAQWEAALTEAFATGRERSLECMFQAPGGLRSYESRIVPERDAAGNVETVLVITRDFTERKRAEEALRSSDEFLRRVIASSRDCIKVLDLDGRILSMNASGLRLMEIDDIASLLNTSWLEFVQEPGRGAMCNALAAARRGGSGEFEYYCPTAKGTPKWWDVIVTPILDAAGRPEKLLAVSRDVTERKKAEDEFRRQKKLLDALFDNLPLGIFIKDAKSLRYLKRNRFSEARFGHRGLDSAGRTAYDLFPREQADRYCETDREALETGQMVEIAEQEALGKSGEVRIQHVRKLPLFDELGQPWILVGISDDITERKRAEMALRESEQRFRLLAENMREVFWIATRDRSRIVYINRAYERIWGRSRESLYRDPMEWGRHIAFDDLAAVAAFVDKQKRGEPAEQEYRVLRRDGAIRWVRDSSFPLSTEQGIELIAGMAEDITERKLAEEKRVADLVRQRDTLVREVHHRIKNNLQGVTGLLRQLASGYPEVRTLVDKAISQLQAIAIVHGLQGRSVRNGILLRDVVPAIAKAIEDAARVPIDVQVTADGNRCLHTSENEAVPVALVLNELMLNAVKRAAARPEPGAVRVTLCVAAAVARISISNEGTLPRGFDFAGGRGVGTGLELVRSLMPQQGMSLAFFQDGERVQATLELSNPAVMGYESHDVPGGGGRAIHE
jgi:PAS domain S-box-containing protein